MFRRRLKNMQILRNIIQFITVNVVNNFSWFSSRYFPVFPLFPIFFIFTYSLLPQALRFKCLMMRAICFFSACVCRFSSSNFQTCCDFIPSPHVFSRRQATNFFYVGVKCVPVSMPHLIVPHTHVSSSNRPLAIATRAPNYLPSPCVVNCSVFFQSFVMHQTQSKGSVFSSTFFNSTQFHFQPFKKALAYILYRYNVLGKRIDNYLKTLNGEVK